MFFADIRNDIYPVKPWHLHTRQLNKKTVSFLRSQSKIYTLLWKPKGKCFTQSSPLIDSALRNSVNTPPNNFTIISFTTTRSYRRYPSLSSFLRNASQTSPSHPPDMIILTIFHETFRSWIWTCNCPSLLLLPVSWAPTNFTAVKISNFNLVSISLY